MKNALILDPGYEVWVRMNDVPHIDRRTFVTHVATAAGSLALGFGIQPAKTAAGMGPTEMVLMAYMNRRNDPTPINLFLYCLGIITTGFALSFGAPFWFEVLVKLVNIRRTGTKPQRADLPTK